MSIFNRFSPPPPPPPFYRRQPVATAALIVTLFATLIIGPSKYIAQGMDAKIEKNSTNIESIQKEKATNENVKDALIELKEQRKESAIANKEQNKSIQTNQQAIQGILIRQKIIKAPSGFNIKTEPVIKKKVITEENIVVKSKVALTPEQFEKYLSMAPDVRAKYKTYLKEIGKNVSMLPD